MSKNTEFLNFILEQMEALLDIHARAMFGGHGIYQGEVMFAIVADGGLYFKVDESTREDFVARGLQPFTYEAKAKSIALQYYAAPPEVFDEEEAMIAWSKRAIEVALRASRERKPPEKRPRAPRR
ncbi:MAG TPA: TfoX/Sxy family protein [Gammaproteobacteria bacterium]|nr:TfoX/Sxy family protein [Gammaproteobacteria bacterium]